MSASPYVPPEYSLRTPATDGPRDADGAARSSLPVVGPELRRQDRRRVWWSNAGIAEPQERVLLVPGHSTEEVNVHGR